MTEHNNPPAFPEVTWEYDGQGNVLPFQNHGMTLLDHFAGLAMQALISLGDKEKHIQTHEDRALFAYYAADAMLKELDKWIK